MTLITNEQLPTVVVIILLLSIFYYYKSTIILLVIVAVLSIALLQCLEGKKDGSRSQLGAAYINSYLNPYYEKLGKDYPKINEYSQYLKNF
jgi:ABC-type dipeptide/oligopeptide/nickel transport system permease component